jgi:hypothetical protein
LLEKLDEDAKIFEIWRAELDKKNKSISSKPPEIPSQTSFTEPGPKE